MIATRLSLAILSFLFTGCAAHRQAAGIVQSSTISSLRLLGMHEIPYQTSFHQTTIGGLSGIDYNTSSNVYYLISDDRSAIQPARYYTATIAVSATGIDSVQFLSVTTLRQFNGLPYPALTPGATATPDPEAIRFHAATQKWVWSSEGERIVKARDTTLISPAVFITDQEGICVDTLSLPPCLYMRPVEKGPRQNGTLEGLAFADNNTLFASVEEPLYEDGPRAGATNGGFTRIIRFDMHSHKSIAQYAYPLDAIAHPPRSASIFAGNGVSDILAINARQLLVTERSYTASIGFTIKLFLADITHAGDISSTPSLVRIPPVKPIIKQLLLNMDSLHCYVDNVEGATFGPLLPNGHRTLLLVTDNNFNQEEKTQLFLFEVLP